MAYWGNNPAWTGLSSREKASAMALLEADLIDGKIDVGSARNALGAMINRAAKNNEDIGAHVSGKIYQPTIEDAQFARLSKIVGSPEHKQLMDAYDARTTGKEADWVNGATHFLAPEKVMLNLEAQDPQKYRSWRKWTGFDDATGEYKGVTLRDRSHAFLSPDGAHSAKFGDGTAAAPTAVAEAAPAPSGLLTAALAPQPEALKPEAPKGMLGSLFEGDAESLKVSAGLLGDILNPQPKPQQQAEKRTPIPGVDNEDVGEGDPMPKMQRRPIDTARLAAILQSRSRLGTV